MYIYTLSLYTCDSENSYISLWYESELTYEQQIICYFK